MDIIISHSERFGDALENFAEPNDEGLDIYDYVRSIISVDITAYQNVLVYPTVMGFNSMLLLFPDYDDGSEPRKSGSSRKREAADTLRPA